MTKICLLPIFLLLTVVALANITIEINAGDFDRKETLISFPVPRELSSVDHFSLRNMDNRAKVGIQRKDSLLFFVLDQPLAAGQSRQYQLSSRKRSADYSAKALYRLPEVILSIDDQTVLHYHIQEKLAPGQPEYYKRSGFIHPLKTPGGKILTDDFPLGHAHQHALFFAWRNTTYKGENVDFWNQQDKTGTVGHQKLIDHFSGEVLTGFQSRLEHLSLKQGVVLEETWAVSATKAGPYFIVDLQSIQENTSKDTLFIHQYLYGGLGLRGSKHWNRDDSLNYTGEMNILTSESKTRVEANHTKPQWIKMFGEIEKIEAGLLAMGHPGNFRSPQSIRVHPEMPYFCFAPVVDGAFDLLPGQVFESSFRFILYDNELSETEAERLWKDYMSPVEVKLVE